MAAPDPHLSVRGLSVQLGRFSLRSLELACARGEYQILLGPTGSGKTSLLKCILGLCPIQGGSIRLSGREISREPPERRRMGYVPQNYALFPHLSAEENLRFGLRARNTPRGEADRLADRLVGMLKIETLLKRRVHHLSGGERQKIALGRALATQPEMILLDEPFSSIDEGAKRHLWLELRRIIGEVGITVVHVTHNLEEAYTLGERLSVLINGELVQTGSTAEVFERPANESVARYLNYRNIISGVTAGQEEGAIVDCGHFRVRVKDNFTQGQTVRLCVRQQDVKIIREGLPIKETLRANVFSGTIVSLSALPDSCLIWLQLPGSSRDYDFEVKVPFHVRDRLSLQPGKQIQVAFTPAAVITFPEN